MPICNDFKDRKGCGQEIQWIPNPQKPGRKMMANLDGSEHKHSGTPTSGSQQVQVHTQAQKYMGELVTGAINQTPLADVRDQVSSLNNNVMTLLNEFRDLNVNIADFLRGLKIKGKVDYKKDDNAPTLEDDIKQIKKDVAGLSESFVSYGELNKAALEKGGMISAAELYKQKQQTEQIKIDNP